MLKGTSSYFDPYIQPKCQGCHQEDNNAMNIIVSPLYCPIVHVQDEGVRS